MQAIVSVFNVTELKSGKSYREFVPGQGQQAIIELRKDYSPLTVFVLEGFEVDGKFSPLEFR